jgi:phospholipase/lecithinase/hemolysin
MRLSLGVLVYILGLSNAVAAPYRALFAFGDSYSDIGARFLDSDGPTAVAYLAEHMGVAMTYPQDPTAVGKSLNFAASGAISGKEAGFIFKGRTWCCQGMMDQVEEFAREVRSGSISFDPETTLFFIAGGLNDGRFPTEVTVRNLKRQILLLTEVGAKHITVSLLPTKIPDFTAVAERLNPAYRKMVSELSQQLDIDLQLNHWGTYFDDVMENPSSYGILNITSRCAGRALFDEDTTPCSAPQTYYYYHEGHPSAAVNRIVGMKLYQEISGDTSGHSQDVADSHR